VRGQQGGGRGQVWAGRGVGPATGLAGHHGVDLAGVTDTDHLGCERPERAKVGIRGLPCLVNDHHVAADGGRVGVDPAGGGGDEHSTARHPARHPALGRNPALKNIFVVAHPEASHHRDGLVGGWFDSDLTERGVRHADNIADALLQRLRGTEVEIRTSDLHRARRTAEIIGSRLCTTPKIDPDLREKSFGEAEGKPQQWLRERTIPLPEHGERLQHDEGIPGAETRMDLAQRAYTAMARIQESPAVDQVIVTHGGTITFLIAAWIGMPIEASGRAHPGLIRQHHRPTQGPR
jgi:probable phosphoglycerate mutase